MNTNELTKAEREKLESSALVYAFEIREIRLTPGDIGKSMIFWNDGTDPTTDDYLRNHLQIIKGFGLTEEQSIRIIHKAFWRWRLGYDGSPAKTAPLKVIREFKKVAKHLHEIIPSPDGDPGKAILRFKDKSPTDDPILKESIGTILDFSRDKEHSFAIFMQMRDAQGGQ